MMRQNINNYFSGLMENEKLIKKNMEKSILLSVTVIDMNSITSIVIV